MRTVHTKIICKIDREMPSDIRRRLLAHIRKCRDSDLDPARLPPELMKQVIYDSNGIFGSIEQRLRKEHKEGLFLTVEEFEGRKAVVEEMLGKIGIVEEYRPIALEVMRMLFGIVGGRPVSITLEDYDREETIALQCHEVAIRIYYTDKIFEDLRVFCEGVYRKPSAPRPEYRDAKIIRFSNLREGMEDKINRLMDYETLFSHGANKYSIEYDVANVGGLGRYNKQCQVCGETEKGAGLC